MNYKKIAKHLTETNKTTFNNTFNAAKMLQDNSQRIFFHFVDKNPLFQNNSKDAIHEYIRDSRRKRAGFKPYFDEGYENVTGYLIRNRLHYRDK